MADRLSLMTDRGLEFRSWLPPVLQDAPDILAVLHCIARETARLEGCIEQVRAQFFPQTADLLLHLWERELRTTESPVGQTIEERRAIVMALLARLHQSPKGTDWQATVTKLIGDGWDYEEHDPDDPSSPPPATIRVSLPYPASSNTYKAARRRILEVTPAHLNVQTVSTTGFQLDQSQLDQEQMP